MGMMVQQTQERQVQNMAQVMAEQDVHDESMGHNWFHGFAELLRDIGFGDWAYIVICGLALIGGYWVFKRKILNFFHGLFK